MRHVQPLAAVLQPAAACCIEGSCLACGQLLAFARVEFSVKIALIVEVSLIDFGSQCAISAFGPDANSVRARALLTWLRGYTIDTLAPLPATT